MGYNCWVSLEITSLNKEMLEAIELILYTDWGVKLSNIDIDKYDGVDEMYDGEDYFMLYVSCELRNAYKLEWDELHILKTKYKNDVIIKFGYVNLETIELVEIE